jgi:hypothetical protein
MLPLMSNIIFLIAIFNYGYKYSSFQAKFYQVNLPYLKRIMFIINIFSHVIDRYEVIICALIIDKQIRKNFFSKIEIKVFIIHFSDKEFLFYYLKLNVILTQTKAILIERKKEYCFFK